MKKKTHKEHYEEQNMVITQQSQSDVQCMMTGSIFE